MLELRSGIIRKNGDKYYFTRSSTGQYRWVDAATNLGVPDSRACLLEHLYGHRIRNIKAEKKGDGMFDDIRVPVVAEEDSRIVDANDAITGKGADGDIHYALAVDDVESLTSMGSGKMIEPGYADDPEEHPADANADFPVERVA